MRTWLFSSATLTLLLVFGCCAKKETATGSAPTEDGKGRVEAPKHNAPEQDRIDSLKNEKQKTKNP